MDPRFEQDAIGWCHSCGLVQRFSEMPVHKPSWASSGDYMHCCINCEGEPWEIGVWPIYPVELTIDYQAEEHGWEAMPHNFVPEAPLLVGAEIWGFNKLDIYEALGLEFETDVAASAMIAMGVTQIAAILAQRPLEKNILKRDRKRLIEAIGVLTELVHDLEADALKKVKP